jgi:Bacterial HORMA domain family 1
MSRTATFSVTDARQIASKLGADLRNLNIRHGAPPLADIPGYVEEVAQYLNNGYLEDVSYGFKDGSRWILRLRYHALEGGHLSDGAPGALPNIDVSGYPFHSYLRWSSAFGALTAAEQQVFKSPLPVTRTPGTEPTAYGGITANSASYSRNGIGLGRDVYRAV